MNVITIILLIFAVLGAIDRIFGNRFGLGGEFERGFGLLGPMSLTMIGVLVIAPALASWLEPFFTGFYNIFGIDPSIIPASLFANDMGGVGLSLSTCKDEYVGAFNAYVVSSMMGCTISYTLPLALSVVKREQHKDLFFGLLCGIITIPVGCFISGLICKIHPLTLIKTLLPIIILAALIALGIIFAQNLCIKIFKCVAIFMNALITIGLIIGIFTAVTGIEIAPQFDSYDNAALVCARAAITLAGAFPLMFVITKILAAPIRSIGRKTGLNAVSTVSLLSTIVSATPVLGIMGEMDRKGVVLNSAFAVSAAFTFGGHLAFTMAYDPSYTTAMIIGKLISGVAALLLAGLLYKKREGKI